MSKLISAMKFKSTYNFFFISIRLPHIHNIPIRTYATPFFVCLHLKFNTKFPIFVFTISPYLNRATITGSPKQSHSYNTHTTGADDCKPRQVGEGHCFLYVTKL